MASRKRKAIGFRTEEELADAVNEIVNGSDSDTDNNVIYFTLLFCSCVLINS